MGRMKKGTTRIQNLYKGRLFFLPRSRRIFLVILDHFLLGIEGACSEVPRGAKIPRVALILLSYKKNH